VLVPLQDTPTETPTKTPSLLLPLANQNIENELHSDSDYPESDLYHSAEENDDAVEQVGDTSSISSEESELAEQVGDSNIEQSMSANSPEVAQQDIEMPQNSSNAPAGNNEAPDLRMYSNVDARNIMNQRLRRRAAKADRMICSQNDTTGALDGDVQIIALRAQQSENEPSTVKDILGRADSNNGWKLLKMKYVA
jgi:hypothetical protein